MRQRTLIGLATALFSSTVVSACAPVSVAEEAIVGGTRGGNPAVLWVYDTSSGGSCSASLIAPRVVLTAKHCVQGPGDTRTNPAALRIGTGDFVGRGRQFRAQSAYTTPGVWTESSTTGIAGAIVGVDVAVIVLSSPIDTITPLPIFRGDPRTLRGQTFTACGFGLIPGGDAGVKYTAMGTVAGVSGGVIYVGNIICQGDSGGPMIMPDGSVAGVVSFGNGTTCGTGTGAYNTLAPFLDMIDMALDEGGTCVTSGAELCDGRDNDCNGMVDETCLPLGELCENNAQCVGALCADTIDGLRCSSTCDARNPTLGCEDGLYCAASPGECGGFCVPSQGGSRTGANNTPCSLNEDCASLNCADRGDGVLLCLTPCGDCLSAVIVSGGHQRGEPCSDGSQCVTDNCLSDTYPGRAPRQYCTQACGTDADCGDRFHCRDSLCIAGPRGQVGDTCITSADCVSTSFCASQGPRRWCTQTCGTCEAGFTCTDVGGAQICVPDAGLVGDGCATAADCVTNLCALGASIDGMPGTCTRNCGPATPCPTGLACQRLADGVSAACVWPAAATPPSGPPSGGCAAGGSGSPSAAAVFALSLAGLLARRRKNAGK